MTTATENRYIVRNDEILSGEPIIKGTRHSRPRHRRDVEHGRPPRGDPP